MPDLNRDHGRPVLRAGPQPRSWEASVVCTSRMSERMSEHMSEEMSERMSEDMSELETDFFKRGHVVGMYWENIARSMVERAHRDAQQLDVPLFCLQAADQRHERKNKTIDRQLTHQLLTVPNPHRTGKLQGMLLVHENMIVRLSDVLAPHLGLVKDKMTMVVKVDLHHEDQERLRHRDPGFCHFAPEYMAKGIWVKLLKGKSSPMDDALLETWEEQFENVTQMMRRHCSLWN